MIKNLNQKLSKEQLLKVSKIPTKDNIGQNLHIQSLLLIGLSVHKKMFIREENINIMEKLCIQMQEF